MASSQRKSYVPGPEKSACVSDGGSARLEKSAFVSHSTSYSTEAMHNIVLCSNEGKEEAKDEETNAEKATAEEAEKREEDDILVLLHAHVVDTAAKRAADNKRDRPRLWSPIRRQVHRPLPGQ